MTEQEEIKIFMAKFEQKVENIECQLKNIPTRNEMELILTKAIDSALKNCDERYASKITEKIVRYIGIAIGLGFLGVIGKIILSYFKI